MNPETTNETILRTLANLNEAWEERGANAIIATRDGEVNPARAYVELVREILALAE